MLAACPECHGIHPPGDRAKGARRQWRPGENPRPFEPQGVSCGMLSRSSDKQKRLFPDPARFDPILRSAKSTETAKLGGCDSSRNARSPAHRNHHLHPPQGRLRLARLPQEPRRLRGHDGPAPPQRRRAHPAAEDAEILVVNTCSFIDSAKQESVNTILEMARHKVAAGGKARRLIVAGCLVERYRDEIQKNIPEVDAVVGTGELEAILAAAGLHALRPREQLALQHPPAGRSTPSQDLISRAPSAVHQHSHPTRSARRFSPRLQPRPRRRAPKATPASSPAASRAQHWDGATAALPEYLYSDETPRILTTPRASAYIKIAEGCDHPCSFCIIPQLRGKFRSRRMSSIVAEAENLIAQGVREITLIGQDTTCYGEDLGLQGRPRAAARSARRAARAALAALPLHLSEQGHHAPARDDGEVTTPSRSTSTCRCSTPAQRCSSA